MSLDEFHAINAAYPWFFAFWAFVFGACWGSFYNVVIYRVPAGKSVVKPGSHCYACNTPIKWYDNLPILSWCILRGKARCCGAPFSVRYAIIEAMTGLFYMTAWLVYSQHLGVVVAIWIFIALMICNAFIDYDTQYLHDAFTVWGMMIGVVLSALYPDLHQMGGSGDPIMLERLRSIALSVTGALVGSGLIVWIAEVSGKILRKDTMGYGDVVLMGCIGAFVGWKGAVFAIFGGSLLGSLVVLPLLMFNTLTGKNVRPGKTGHIDEDEEVDKGDQTSDSAIESSATDADKQSSGEEEEQLGIGSAIPFGPWLSLGALVYVLFVRKYVDQYFDSTIDLIFSPVRFY
ncbi:prepilin peptidase [Cerasicoccus fimbriatus]|uniref:prepilin peptidase n=1 Tax=Cerasicoccus fimbriatus TaxID=3014554 RepID=UPI0022B2F3AB|nr:A24 family peptidase [Cerasicoccus sp. TK19100]